jgi:hypothetical protein
MDFRNLFGKKLTIGTFAADLIAAADRAGVTGLKYKEADSTLADGQRVINLVNLFAEYSRAPASERPALFKKYLMLIAPPKPPEPSGLWSLAQTRIFPLLRSRYEYALAALKQRNAGKTLGPRASRAFVSHLEVVLGYDHGQTVAQVQVSSVAEWGVPLEDAIERSLQNLRGLPPPRWVQAAPSLWKLESDGGYHESFLLMAKIFEGLPAKGRALAMIPNRGVLLATGTDEPQGVAALLAAARGSIQGSPWPLCGELFCVTRAGIETHEPDEANAALLATIKRIDLAGFYEPQKAELQKYCQSLQDDAYVASYSLYGKKGSHESQSWCSWSEGVRSLLPKTDLIAFVQDPTGTKKTFFVPWNAAEPIVGHHFKPTSEEPMRTRVETFPTAGELAELERFKTAG